jgi:hypothetical protein
MFWKTVICFHSQAHQVPFEEDINASVLPNLEVVISMVTKLKDLGVVELVESKQ